VLVLRRLDICVEPNGKYMVIMSADAESLPTDSNLILRVRGAMNRSVSAPCSLQVVDELARTLVPIADTFSASTVDSLKISAGMWPFVRAVGKTRQLWL